jgi:predicted choloylglycine hydrolase
MKSKKFKGKHYEIGKVQGKFYKKEKLSLQKTINRQVLTKQLQIYSKHYPEYLEKLRGIADSMDEPLEKIQFNFLALPLVQLQRKKKTAALYSE